MKISAPIDQDLKTNTSHLMNIAPLDTTEDMNAKGLVQETDTKATIHGTEVEADFV